MNPCVPQQVIDAATEQDPTSAAAEWLAHFRSDVQALLTCEAVQAWRTSALKRRINCRRASDKRRRHQGQR
jgi:hypothetical protein